MAFTKKSWQDHLSASFGQVDEAIRSKTGSDGLIVGGVMEGTATAVEDGDFAIPHFDANQNLMVNIAEGEVMASLGTVDVLKAGSIVVKAGTVVAGTINNLDSGSVVVTAGTIGDLDTVGTVGVVNDGSVDVTALPDLPGGTIDLVTSITNVAGGSVVVTAGTMANVTVTGGTIANLDAGSVVVTAGTIGDLDTVGTVGVVNDGSIDVTALPDLPGGTIDAVTSITNVAAGSIIVTAGTIGDLDTVGTVGVVNDGSVDVTALPDLPGGTVDLVTSISNVAAGSIIVTAGTMANVTVTGGTIANLDAGSVVVTAGTIGDLDTVGTVGVINDGSIDVTALPDLPGGTIDAVTSITNVAAGSIIVTAGTIGDLDTVGTVGVLNDGSVDVTALVDLPGGTVDLVTSVGNIAAGSIIVTAGTIGDLDTVGTVGVVNDGSVDVTALPDLPGGTIDLVTSVSNVAAGSIIVTAGTITQSSLVAEEIGTVQVATPGSAGTTTIVVNGLTKQIHFVTPDMEDTDTTELILKDSNAYQVYASGELAESTTHALNVERALQGTTTLIADAQGTQSTNRDCVYSIKYMS